MWTPDFIFQQSIHGVTLTFITSLFWCKLLCYYYYCLMCYHLSVYSPMSSWLSDVENNRGLARVWPDPYSRAISVRVLEVHSKCCAHDWIWLHHRRTSEKSWDINTHIILYYIHVCYWMQLYYSVSAIRAIAFRAFIK
jgi:hypothetical protein